MILNQDGPPHDDHRACQNVAVLGATGSIGTATIDVVRQLNQVDPENRWHISAASGHRNTQLLAELVGGLDQPPDQVILSNNVTNDDLGSDEARLRALGSRIEFGPEALVSAASDESVDVVVAAIVGRAGLESTLAAVEAGNAWRWPTRKAWSVPGPW